MVAEPFDFKSAVDKVLLVVRILPDLELERIVETVQTAHTIGPFVDPTTYRDALYRGDMDELATICRALAHAKTLAVELLERHGAAT